jgi:hypothetical protein
MVPPFPKPFYQIDLTVFGQAAAAIAAAACFCISAFVFCQPFHWCSEQLCMPHKKYCKFAIGN